MGIYIKDMEMPKSCKECPFSDHEAWCLIPGNWRKRYYCPTDEVSDDCPLVEVPDGHGDLIDRNVAEQDAQARMLICDKYDNQFQKPYEVMRAIALAPAIIPADPE